MIFRGEIVFNRERRFDQGALGFQPVSVFVLGCLLVMREFSPNWEACVEIERDKVAVG